MSVVWLLTTAYAAPPDELRTLLDLDPGASIGQVERMKVDPVGEILTGRSQGDTSGWLIDINTWDVVRFAPCDVTGVAPMYDEASGTTQIWIACGNGQLLGQQWDGLELTDLLDDDGAPLAYDVDASLSDVWVDGGFVYALSVADSISAVVHLIDPSLQPSNPVSNHSALYPLPLVFPGYVEGTVINGNLVVTHGARGISSLVLATGGITTPQLVGNDCDDLAPSAQNSVYCVDRTIGNVTEYPLPIGGAGLVLGALNPLTGPEAVGASLDLDDGWIAVTGQQVVVWETVNGVIQTPPVFEGATDADNPINDMVSYDGYLFGGGPDGGLHIVSARPWVYPGRVEVTVNGAPFDANTDPPAVAGDEVEITFEADEDVEYNVFNGGDREGTGTALLSPQGEALADTPESITLTVGDQFQEGSNNLFIVVEDRDGLRGHARAELTVDNPPSRPNVRQADVQWGDGRLTFNLNGISDEDLDFYTLYVRAEAWEADDFPTGGPDFDGTTELEAPIIIQAEGGENVTVEISPLENDVTYYIGVRATDTGDKEGPMSAIVSGRPRETFTASKLENEQGGAPCSTGAGGLASWLAVCTGLAAVGMRRRRSIAAWALVAALGLPTVAQAQDMADEPTPFWERRDLTPARGNFEVRYGVINFDNPSEDELSGINQVYGGRDTNLLLLEVGPQLFRVAELDFGFGYFRERANTIDGAGVASADETALTLFPFSFGITGRLHLLDEQPLVPFVQFGVDYVLWNERFDIPNNERDRVNGAKLGTHRSLGLNLLLDIFQPNRASLLEARSGINDTWLTFEWRRQSIDGRSSPFASAVTEGLIFSGDAFLVGLKLDY